MLVKYICLSLWRVGRHLFLFLVFVTVAFVVTKQF